MVQFVAMVYRTIYQKTQMVLQLYVCIRNEMIQILKKSMMTAEPTLQKWQKT